VRLQYSWKDPEAYRQIIGWQHEAFAHDGPNNYIVRNLLTLILGKHDIYHVQDIFRIIFN
jgi:hypothetical protein